MTKGGNKGRPQQKAVGTCEVAMPTTWKQDEDGMGDKAVDRGRLG
jgi:hypothetical protein